MVQAVLTCLLLTLSLRFGQFQNVDKIVLGRYLLVSNIKAEDFNEVLKAMEFSDSYRENLTKTRDLEFELVSNPSMNKFRFNVTGERRNRVLFVNDFQNGKPFDGKLIDGRQYFAAKMTINGSIFIREEYYRKDFSCRHVAKFNHAGCDINYNVIKSDKNVTAKQIFRQIPNLDNWNPHGLKN